MRHVQSAFVFSAVEPRLVRDCLDGIAQRTDGDTWVIDERMWIHMYNPPDWTDGFENERAEIERRLGSTVTLVATDVGKWSGTEEVRSFALAILALGPGLAFDDDTSRGWTAPDLATDEAINGRKFFSGDGTAETPPRKPKFWQRRRRAAP